MFVSLFFLPFHIKEEIEENMKHFPHYSAYWFMHCFIILFEFTKLRFRQDLVTSSNHRFSRHTQPHLKEGDGDEFTTNESGVPQNENCYSRKDTFCSDPSNTKIYSNKKFHTDEFNEKELASLEFNLTRDVSHLLKRQCMYNLADT